jgi:two-component system chemotaxis response regulator CheY
LEAEVKMAARVLIVDDSLFMRTQIRNILSGAGYLIAGEASDGKQAEKKYKDLNPDIVIMDITMPGINGIEALRKIKSYDRQARVIMCTSLGQNSKVKEAITSGADDYIIKPFQKERVLQAIEKVLNL